MRRSKIFCEITDLLDKPNNERMKLWQLGTYCLYFLPGDQLDEACISYLGITWMRLWCFMTITTISELLNRLELLYTEKNKSTVLVHVGQGLQSMLPAFLLSMPLLRFSEQHISFSSVPYTWQAGPWRSRKAVAPSGLPLAWKICAAHRQ